MSPVWEPGAASHPIAGKRGTHRESPTPGMMQYLWEPRLPAMGCEAAPAFVT
ncbi:hypothetical protein KMS_R41670 [Pseudomonas sp. LRP2-20]|uniref:hypothetical protein n=1 Tax=Pseudomonas sp. LRP2-20 TaxID=2944234 RepID=UPI0021876419|nr:hypothetical protein [Pseudomonas sp. LRP2-20]BDM24410.1 hypothetical protein KMS_R41670 [Pseudomonas sp. LRP2-20]